MRSSRKLNAMKVGSNINIVLRFKYRIRQKTKQFEMIVIDLRKAQFPQIYYTSLYFHDLIGYQRLFNCVNMTYDAQ